MDAGINFTLRTAVIEQAVEVGDGLSRCQFAIMRADRPVEQQAKAIDRAQRRFFDLGMNGIQPLEMLIAQRCKPVVQPVKRLPMRRAN